MLYDRLIAVDVFIVLGIVGFLFQSWIITYSLKLMWLMRGYKKWRYAWLLWAALQTGITFRRLYTLHMIMVECNEATFLAQYRGWLFDGSMLIIFSIGYLVFMKLLWNIFSDTFGGIYLPPKEVA